MRREVGVPGQCVDCWSVLTMTTCRFRFGGGLHHGFPVLLEVGNGV